MSQTPPENLVDNYMAHIAAQLKSLPAAVRDEHLRELRQHIDQLVAARAGQPDAVQSALSQMGNAKHVGRRLAGEWKRKQRPRMSRELWAVLCALACYALAVSVTHSGDIFMGRMMNSTSVLVALVGIPLLTGAVTGILFPKVAVSAALYATASVVGLLLLSPAAMLLAWETDAATIYALKVFAVQAACWLPLSGLAAYVTSALRRGKLYRVTWQDLRLQ